MPATLTIPPPTSTTTPEPTSTPTLVSTNTLTPTVPPTATAIPLEECTSYDASALQIAPLGDKGWGLSDGLIQIALMDSETDAQLALALAERHNEICFIGRAYSDGYFMQYWRGESGISNNLRNGDGSNCDAQALSIIFDANLWTIVESGSYMLQAFEKGEAANLGLEVMKQYSKMCFIGRGNSRENRKEYILTYWE
jgi:hypothetical protein